MVQGGTSPALSPVATLLLPGTVLYGTSLRLRPLEFVSSGHDAGSAGHVRA